MNFCKKRKKKWEIFNIHGWHWSWSTWENLGPRSEYLESTFGNNVFYCSLLRTFCSRFWSFHDLQIYHDISLSFSWLQFFLMLRMFLFSSLLLSSPHGNPTHLSMLFLPWEILPAVAGAHDLSPLAERWLSSMMLWMTFSYMWTLLSTVHVCRTVQCVGLYSV